MAAGRGGDWAVAEALRARAAGDWNGAGRAGADIPVVHKPARCIDLHDDTGVSLIGAAEESLVGCAVPGRGAAAMASDGGERQDGLIAMALSVDEQVRARGVAEGQRLARPRRTAVG